MLYCLLYFAYVADFPRAAPHLFHNYASCIQSCFMYILAARLCERFCTGICKILSSWREERENKNIKLKVSRAIAWAKRKGLPSFLSHCFFLWRQRRRRRRRRLRLFGWIPLSPGAPPSLSPGGKAARARAIFSYQ